MILNYFYVMAGAALGGLLRYVVADLVQRNSKIIFPFGTLTVNILGSFLLGLIIFFLGEREIISPELRLFLTVGICGGFTTFSTFSYETLALIQSAEFLQAAYNILLNVILSVAAVYLAYLLSKIL
ncbi:Membrane protein [Ignavibacterium album JCM 16511]|uniref:Fluoride-specific ion channel FluC n=1 Tax=Ignavibacterium album (strain DSM 19864 / JCM 16511 / NBRC 101810 / Mat9-16) TaxID=945713 RepID=I0AFH5_IGNAJ|nr:fluoride efflux transporter CrcB [Ignavibacterium album]AFH47732.1 Membrane protein [Ignavibacterium album JCM 16511]